MGLTTIGLTTEQTVEIISSYATPTAQIPSVTATPGWYVFGEQSMPVDSDALLEVIGLVSDASAHLHVRLYDFTAAAVVNGSLVDITALEDVRLLSGVFHLVGGHLYQFQAEVICSVDAFGVVRAATLLPSS